MIKISSVFKNLHLFLPYFNLVSSFKYYQWFFLSSGSPFLILKSRMRVRWSFKLTIGTSCLIFEIPDEPPCYVRQCSLCYALILKLSRGPASCILFIMCTAIHNCSSSGSLVFATLRQYVKGDYVTNMITVTNLYWY